MKSIKRLERLGRRFWLAGLGTLDAGRDFAAKQIDQVMEDSQSLGHRLMDKGATMAQSQQNSRSNPVKAVAEKLEALNPFNRTTATVLEQLESKIDALTEVVKALEAKTPAPAKKPARASTRKATATTEADEKPVVAKKTTTRTPRKTTASEPSAAKTPAKKPATRKPAATKPAAKKPAARKPAARKPAAPKPPSSTAKKPASIKTSGE